MDCDIFGHVQGIFHSPWHFWVQRRDLTSRQAVRVFPNFAPLARFALLSSEQSSHLIGAHLQRRRGEGTDFQQLRDYREGDSLRQVDWKTTARMGKLISREYQDERNQQIILMLDTGRRMLAQDGEINHFDQALDAALIVAYLALRQGDAVGLYVGGSQPRWLAPQRGMGAIDQILQVAYDLFPEPVATDYLQDATQILARQQRRALLLWISNVRDEDGEDLLMAAKLLQKRHLLLIASLREQILDETLMKPVETLHEAILAGATAQYLSQRDHVHQLLAQSHVNILDTTCQALPRVLVEEYLRIKRAGRL